MNGANKLLTLNRGLSMSVHHRFFTGVDGFQEGGSVETKKMSEVVVCVVDVARVLYTTKSDS
jgi:hypothetical protein